MQKAREELEMKKRKANAVGHGFLRQECCDQNAPVIKCQVSNKLNVVNNIVTYNLLVISHSQAIIILTLSTPQSYTCCALNLFVLSMVSQF